MSRPNIIWIFVDEWRHDAVGYAGNRYIRTPHLDRLASRGSSFTSAYCEGPVCQPARASVLTVSYPRDHGKFQNTPRGGEFPSADVPNFAHRLHDSGYRNYLVGKTHFFHGLNTEDELKAYGFDRVSQEYDKIMLRRDFIDTPYTRYLDELGLLQAWRAHQDEQTEIMFGRDPQGRRAIPEDLDPQHAVDTFIGRRVCEWIREHDSEQPLFMWAAFIGPHLPFDGPSPYADWYDPEDIPMGPMGFDEPPDNPYGDYIRMVRDLLNTGDYTEDDFRLIAKHYYASISLIDEQVGAIVRTVEEAGIAEDTWIFFSSDHGELLGDHGLLTKGVFYETSVRVPVMVVPPAGSSIEPRVESGLVQGIDVPATLLDVARAEGSGFFGRSLLGDDPAREAVFSQVDGFTMAVTAGHKLVVTTEDLQPQVLYDLQADPEERSNLAEDPGSRRVIDDLLDRHLRPFLAGGKSR